MKHNKKRNTGLMYEFLARHAAEGMVENDQKKVSKSIKLIKKHFKIGTELHREFRLFHALLNTHVKTKDTAEKIIESTRRAAGTYDLKKLDHEKSLLIRDINHAFKDASFYTKKIAEYKWFATVQSLLNEWRNSTSADLVRSALYEEELVEHLIVPKSQNILDETKDDVDDLIVSLMSKKVNQKYDGIMSAEQAKLMNAYVYSLKNENMTSIRDIIESLRTSTLSLLDEHAEKHKNETGFIEKLTELKQLLSTPVSYVDDKTLTRYLRITKLKDEIQGV
jgi:hypothetical protein